MASLVTVQNIFFMHVEGSPLVLGKDDEVFRAVLSNKPPLSHTQNLTEGKRSSPFMEKRVNSICNQPGQSSPP